MNIEREREREESDRQNLGEQFSIKQNQVFDEQKDDKKVIKTTKKIYPQIYSYILPELESHDGWQKIGYTERKDVTKRIAEQTSTAAISLKPEILWHASAFFANQNNSYNQVNQESFTDKDLHKFYIKNGIERADRQKANSNKNFGEEWFYFNGTPEKSRELFQSFASQNYDNFRNTTNKSYTLRDEQEKAVSQTLDYAKVNQTTDFANPNKKAEYLWNAKPRFGKTLASYDFAKRFDAKNILIVTNRPSIANSWFDDYQNFVDGYYFISTTDSLKERKTLTRDDYNRIAKLDKRQITFLSLQDLKGGKRFGGNFSKLEWVADLAWDLLIFDEAHEAGATIKTERAFDQIKRRFTLHLSGTPFKQLAGERFTEENIYNWTYIDEQSAKANELAHGEDSGAHVNLPDLRLFTYKISDMISRRLESGIDIDDTNYGYYFNLNEMFVTNNAGNFVHEKDILVFLDELTRNKKYPFSTDELRNELKHTFWMVGNRVASAKAMARLLKNHDIFGDYHVVIAAGDGRANPGLDDDFDEENENFTQNKKSLDKVREAIKNYDKTITLSVGQLTTGVTVKEWSAILMLSDIKSESLYMQAIFRAQNPYANVDENGQLYRKKSAYVFDFSPNRVLQVYDKFANNLQANVVAGKVTESERQANIAELLNYFPVLAEDSDGEMIELDAEQVLTFPMAIVAKEIVNRGFVTDLLFTINNVFNIPQEVINSLNKSKTSNDTGRETPHRDVEHNPDRERQHQRTISANTNKMLGDIKVYGNKMLAIVEEACGDNDEAFSRENFVDTIIAGYRETIEEPLAIYKDVYSPPKAKLKQVEEDQIKKVKLIAEEYTSEELKKAETRRALAQELAELVENDLPSDTVVREEEDNYKQDKNSEIDQIRAHLRTFTRAIPSFLMAATGDIDKITLQNIENTVSDAEFEEIFSETGAEPFTKDDFRLIRGDKVTINGKEIQFEGFFKPYEFNAAIREFEEKRQALANYLAPTSTEDIFSYIRPLKTNQIFTPRRVVNMMLDQLEQENPGIFENPNLTFADLYVKSGLYLTEIAKRLNRGLEAKIPNESERIKHIFEQQLFGFAPTGIIYNIAHKYIYGNFANIDDKNFVQKDLTEIFKRGETLNMKFDVIVGNPPYQIEIPGRSEQPPIYHYFINSSHRMANTSILIHPARFLFNAGKTPREWNEKILADENFNILMFEQNSSRIFPNTDIKGGVAISFHDRSKKIGPIGTFIHIDELRSIKDKLNVDKEHNFSILIYSNTSYKYSDNFYLENPSYKSRVSGGSKRYMSSSCFEKFPEVFTDIKTTTDSAQIIGLISLKRKTKYFPIKYMKAPNNFMNYKIILPASNGSGAIGEVLSTPLIGQPLIGQPLIGHTETFISIGNFDKESEAQSCMKYIKSKFLRALLGIKKITQGNKRAEVWSEIPLQDFTLSSDIDWTKSIPEIDQQLYKKYNFSQNEINFIEEKVRAME